MNLLKRYGFLVMVLSLTLAFQGCAKNKGVSSAGDGTSTDAGMDGDSSSVSEENLDNFDLPKLSMEEAQNVLNNLTTVYFGYDQTSINSQERMELKRVAAALKTISGAQISIQGHCDERGSNEYNLALGDQRARSVEDYLENLGVSSSQLTAVSYGEERPAMMGSNEGAWTKTDALNSLKNNYNPILEKKLL